MGRSSTSRIKAHKTSDRYDFIKDVTRVERLVAEGHARAGAVIAITNDPGYWSQGRRGTFDAEFRIQEGRRLTGTLRWDSETGDGTKRGREPDLRLLGEHRVVWQPYSTVGAGGYPEFRYLFLPVE